MCVVFFAPLPFTRQWFSLETSDVREAVITVKLYRDSSGLCNICIYMYLLLWCEIISSYVRLSLVLNWRHLQTCSDLFSFIIHSVIEINITDDCLSKILIVLMFCESTNSSSLQSWLLGLHNYLEIRLSGISKLEELLLFYKGYYFINVSQNSIWLHFVAL